MNPDCESGFDPNKVQTTNVTCNFKMTLLGYSHLAAFAFTQGGGKPGEAGDYRSVKAKGGVGVDVEIESRDGSMLTGKNEIKCRWREHFSELLGGEQV